jgi:hypothetical protein
MRKVRRAVGFVSQQDEQWIIEANAWCKAMVIAYFEEHTTGQHTVADVLPWLDNRPNVPTSWARWMSEYQTRYNMVRNACVALARENYLDTGRVPNAHGREAASYVYRTPEPWAIEVHPSSEQERVTGLLRRWLHDHADELRTVSAIAITHTERATHDVEGSGGKAVRGGPSGRPLGRRRG